MVNKKKQLVFDRQAEIVKALAHPIRIAVVDFLRDGPQCVCDIAEHVGSERSNVSRHLSVMTSAGVLENYKDGLKVMYSLQTPCILKFLECVTEALRERLEGERAVLRRLRVR